MAFLVAQGYSYRELTDFEDGPPLSVLLLLNIEAGRLCIQKQKAAVETMDIALVSLFERKVINTYKSGVDQALMDTDVLGRLRQHRESAKTSAPIRHGARSEAQKIRDAQRSIAELNKLNVLLGGGL